MKHISLRMAVVILALAVCLAPVAQAAEKADETSLPAELGIGVASFLCTLPYGIIKVTAGGPSGGVGGFPLLLSRVDIRGAGAGLGTTDPGGYPVTPPPPPAKKDPPLSGLPPARTPA